MTSLVEFMAYCRSQVDSALSNTLPQATNTLIEAARYSSLNGGKRVRPILAFGAAQAALNAELSGNSQAEDTVNYVAAALELIHAYSLIHDDLPAMDDDDLRRGRPTCHKAFDEATAILAGDGLQTLAFELLSNTPNVTDSTRINLVRELAQAAGISGMVGGQALDLEATDKAIDLNALKEIHRLKTGALIRAAVRMGALSTESVSEEALDKLTTYADAIGLAFQIQDDILDVTSDTETLGKQQGADEALNKATYVRLLGLDGAKAKAQQLLQTALSNLETFGPHAEPLRMLARYIVERSH